MYCNNNKGICIEIICMLVAELEFILKYSRLWKQVLKSICQWLQYLFSAWFTHPNVHNHNASDCNNVLVIYASGHLTHSKARNALSRE